MITYEQIQSYWDSIVSISELIQKFKTQGYRNIVIPSRGVCPIYIATTKYHYQKMQYECSIFRELEERLQWKHTEFKNLRTGEIWLPFTAQTGNKEEDENTYQIRLNWCKVLKSILSQDTSVNSIAYHVLTDTIGKEYGRTRSIIIKDAPILMIDTVVSGRAATEIAQALEEIGLTEYKMILAVDAQGNKLQSKYKSQLLGKYSDRIKMVYFEELFTEDQGPTLTSVFGVVYPNLTRALRSEFSDPSIAVGSLHMENGRDILCKADKIMLEKYKKTVSQNRYIPIEQARFQCDACKNLGSAYNATRGLFSQLLFNLGLNKFQEQNFPEINLYLLEELNTTINTYKYSDILTTLDLFEKTTPLNMNTSNEVSSSHVIRCNLEAHDIKKILEKIKGNKIKYQDQYRNQ